MKSATRDSWQTSPSKGKFVPITYEDEFTPAEVNRIRLGLIPREMEDKWFIYFDEPTLFFHRSWTGYLIYKVELRVGTTGGATVASAHVVQERWNYPREPGEAEKILPCLIRRILLEQNYPFPPRS